MPLYEDLQKPPMTMPGPPTVFDPTKEKGLENEILELLKTIKSECYSAKARGAHSVVGYMGYFNRFIPGTPQQTLANIDWRGLYVEYSKEVRNHRPRQQFTDILFNPLFGGPPKSTAVSIEVYRESGLDKLLGGRSYGSASYQRGRRDYILRCLQAKMLIEHFPASSLTAIDYTPTIPAGLSSWSGNAVGSVQTDTRYLIGINLRW